MISEETKLKRYPGEKAAIRFFDVKNPEDVKRLRVIVKHDEVQKRMDSVAGISKGDTIDWAKERGSYGKYFMFAIEGTKEVFGEGSPEIGQVQGFVYLYAGNDEKRTVERLVKAGMLKDVEIEDRRIFEISFAKYPGSPGGQISSGARQACLELARLKKEDEEKVFVYCFIDETNEGSIRVAESCGFERRGRHFYEEDSDEMSALYVLNMTKLKEIVKSKA